MKSSWIEVRGNEARSLERELRRELSPDHALARTPLTAVARREDRDDVLLDLGDGRFAMVHLTWQIETDPRWPQATIYETRPVADAALDIVDE